MKVSMNFRQVAHNKKLEKLVESKITRFDKYELKPSEMKLVFSAKQHLCKAEIFIKGPDLYYKATALADDHMTALDDAMDKLERQLARHKSKVQFHKKHYLSNEGLLNTMNAKLEHKFKALSRSRKGSRAA